MPDYYIVSHRNTLIIPAQGATIEFEDLLVDSLDGVLLAPGPGKRGPGFFRGGYGPPAQVDVPPPRSATAQVLIVVGLSIGRVMAALAAIPNWRSRFDIACAYVIDAYMPQTERSKPAWRRRISRTSRAIAALDHLFIPMTGSLQEYRETFGVPVTMIPLACDVLKYGTGGIDRPIDVVGFGRLHLEHSHLLAEHFNVPQSPRLYFHTNQMHIGRNRDLAEHRLLFWKILGRSRIALAYDVLAVNPGGKAPFSVLAARWFECITAGCLVVGRRPTCSEAGTLLNWEDATVDVPDDAAELIPFFEALLADRNRLEAAHRRNYAQAVARHDWRYRVADMLDCLKLPYPEPLQRSLDSLHSQSRQLRLE